MPPADRIPPRPVAVPHAYRACATLARSPGAGSPNVFACGPPAGCAALLAPGDRVSPTCPTSREPLAFLLAGPPASAHLVERRSRVRCARRPTASSHIEQGPAGRGRLTARRQDFFENRNRRRRGTPRRAPHGRAHRHASLPSTFPRADVPRHISAVDSAGAGCSPLLAAVARVEFEQGPFEPSPVGALHATRFGNHALPKAHRAGHGGHPQRASQEAQCTSTCAPAHAFWSPTTADECGTSRRPACTATPPSCATRRAVRPPDLAPCWALAEPPDITCMGAAPACCRSPKSPGVDRTHLTCKSLRVATARNRLCRRTRDFSAGSNCALGTQTVAFLAPGGAMQPRVHRVLGRLPAAARGGRASCSCRVLGCAVEAWETSGLARRRRGAGAVGHRANAPSMPLFLWW